MCFVSSFSLMKLDGFRSVWLALHTHLKWSIVEEILVKHSGIANFIIYAAATISLIERLSTIVRP